jgi:hypothetical protein
MKNQFLMTLLFTSLYVVIRQAMFGTVSLIHMPVYLMNKGISMTAAVSLFMASLCHMRREMDGLRFWTNACSKSIFIHILLSLSILSKAYFHGFFSDDKMNLTGEVVLLSGALAAYCYWRRHAAELETVVWRTLTILVSVLVSAHLFAMGFGEWVRVQKWNGALPPTTLLCFFLVIASLSVTLWSTKERMSLSSE